jgi:hypothetical protein
VQWVIRERKHAGESKRKAALGRGKRSGMREETLAIVDLSTVVA